MAIGNPVSYWYGTKAQYNAIQTKLEDTLYFITDEHTIYKGDLKFAEGIEQLVAMSDSAPSGTYPAQSKYFNTASGKIFVKKSDNTWGDAYYPIDGSLYYDKGSVRFVHFVATYDGTTITGGSMADVYDAGVSGDSTQGVSVQGTGTVTVADASVSGKGVVKIGDNIKVNNGVISVSQATEGLHGVVKVGTNINVNNGSISVNNATQSQKGVVQLVNSTDDVLSTDKAVTPYYVKQIFDSMQGTLTFDTTTGIEIVNGSTVKNDIATVEEVLTGTTGTNIVDADGLTGALSLGQAVEVSCMPYAEAGTITYVNTSVDASLRFLYGFTWASGSTANKKLGFYDTSSHKFPKYAEDDNGNPLKYLFIADVSGSGTITPNGKSAITLSDTPQRIFMIVTAKDTGYISASANASVVMSNWRQYEVNNLASDAVYYLASDATNPTPDTLFRSTSIYDVRNRYLVKQDMVCPWIPTIGMPDNSDLTVAAGLSYKITYTDDNTHNITVDTIPTNAYGWDSHIQMFVKGASNVKFKTPLVLMDALTSNAGHNLVVKYRNGKALVYVEDTDVGDIVIYTSGDEIGTLEYYLQQNPGDGHENYIVFGAVTDGTPVYAETTPLSYNSNIIGNGVDKTTITGTYTLNSGAVLNVQDVTVSGLVTGSGNLNVYGAVISGSTISGTINATLKNSEIASDVLVNTTTGLVFTGTNTVNGTISGTGKMLVDGDVTIKGSGTFDFAGHATPVLVLSGSTTSTIKFEGIAFRNISVAGGLFGRTKLTKQTIYLTDCSLLDDNGSYGHLINLENTSGDITCYISGYSDNFPLNSIDSIIFNHTGKGTYYISSGTIPNIFVHNTLTASVAVVEFSGELEYHHRAPIIATDVRIIAGSSISIASNRVGNNAFLNVLRGGTVSVGSYQNGTWVVGGTALFKPRDSAAVSISGTGTSISYAGVLS